MSLPNPPTVDYLDLTPPDTYSDLQVYLARNFGILQSMSFGAESDFIHVQPTTSQNVGGANGTNVQIAWDTTPLAIDAATFTHSSSTNPSRITVLATGRYSVKATLSAQTTGGARTTLMSSILVNGVTPVTRGRQRNYSRGAAYGDIAWSHDTEIELTANDYIEIRSTVDDTDGVYTINSIVADCELIMRRIG